MTVEELIEQADAICARYREREAPLRADDRERFLAIATEAWNPELATAAFAQQVGFDVCGRSASGAWDEGAA